MPDPIYLDHAATTPVRPEVLEAMAPFYGPRFGNPSSTHRWGREARTALDEARERVAACLGASADELCFTSGGTESDNLAILGGWRILRAAGRKVVVTAPTEHKAVLASVQKAAAEGAVERMLAVESCGTVLMDDAREQITDDVAIASVMWINNEIGTVQPIAELAGIAKSRGVIFHTDAVQAFGKVEVDARKVPFDFASISGHKIGAPKGVGAMYLRRGTPLEPLFFGGTQDRGRRPGTENVAFAVALATACELALQERETVCAKYGALRDRLEAGILAKLPDARVNGAAGMRAPHILNITVPGVDGESMLMALDLHGIACSGGSACQSGSSSPSHVLDAIGASSIPGASVRMSVGSLSNEAAIDRAIDVFTKLALKARGTVAA
ncbi:MAG: cysteine desulfurase family protein [Gemmatimonadetes bacterium]|nr:cysteine desulfurase family protein [Gemmatimonadota bacterium]